MVVAGHVAVVGGVEDERVLQHPPRLQRLQDAPDFLVHVGHAPVVALARVAHLFRAEVAVPDAVAIVTARAVALCPLPDVRGGQVTVLVEVHPAFGRIVGRVGPDEGHLEEEGLGPLVALDKAPGRFPRPVRGVQALGQYIGPGAVGVGADARGADLGGRCFGREPRPVVTPELGRLLSAGLVEDEIVKAMAAALGRPVHFANAQRVVASVPEHLGHLDRIFRGDLGIAQHPVVPGVHARQERRARGGAGGRGGVGATEERAFPCEAVHVGGVYDGIPVGPDAIGAVLIGQKEQNVGLARVGARPGVGAGLGEGGGAGAEGAGLEEMAAGEAGIGGVVGHGVPPVVAGIVRDGSRGLQGVHG